VKPLLLCALPALGGLRASIFFSREVGKPQREPLLCGLAPLREYFFYSLKEGKLSRKQGRMERKKFGKPSNTIF